MNFTHLLKGLLRRKWIILICVGIAVLTVFLLTMNEKKEFKSTAQIATGFTVTDEARFSQDRISVPQMEMKFNNVIENFNSSKVLSLLSYNLMLHDLTEKPFRTLSEDAKESSSFKEVRVDSAIKMLNQKLYNLQPLNVNIPEENKLLRFIKLHNYDVESIKSKLNIARVPRTDYINIEFLSPNPELSAFTVNALVTEFSNYYIGNRRQGADTSIANIEALVKQKKAELDAKTAAKTAYMSNNGIVDINMEGSDKLTQISSYEGLLAQEKANRQTLSFRIRQLEGLIREARNKSAAPPARSSVDNQVYLTLKAQHADLYKEYIQKGANDPEMKRKLDDISRRMQQLDPSTTADNTPVTTNLDQLVQLKIDAEGGLRGTDERIRLYEGKLGQLSGGLNTMASRGAGVEQLDREIQLASAEYTTANERLNTIKNINELGANSFKQTLFGQPALHPEPTHRSLKMLLAGICALVLSSLVIIFKEVMDQSIKTPSQFQKLTRLRLLGTINQVNFKKNVLQNIGHFNGDDKQRDDTFRELLRKIRFELENSGKQIFLFTSTEPQQGKTTLIQALSYSLSLIKKKVLIIDTNFCNNDLTVLLSANPVLEKFHVNGKPFTVNDVQKLVTKTGVEGVDLIGCEGGDYTPREILPKNHLLNYLSELTKEYDYIFLEGAPLNDFTDTKELIHYSDGIIAVFSSEAALTAADRESIKYFKHREDKFIGAILNKVTSDNLNM
jgi:uncharacterized protein involved in exopolysaccharide biosynthesis/Mrp family chromosome partitioning ATPase